jgi:hypothetical protein
MSAPATDREQILNALFTQLQTAVFASPISGRTTFGLSSRRLLLFGQVDPSLQPSMFLVEHDEDDKQPGRGQPVKRQIDCLVVCYARTDNATDIGGTFINLMLGSIEKTLAPDAAGGYEVCTLGGLVYRCWIEGKIHKDPGDIDSQAWLVVPVHILWP